MKEYKVSFTIKCNYFEEVFDILRKYNLYELDNIRVVNTMYLSEDEYQK